jgi:hypothetical protein
MPEFGSSSRKLAQPFVPQYGRRAAALRRRCRRIAPARPTTDVVMDRESMMSCPCPLDGPESRAGAAVPNGVPGRLVAGAELGSGLRPSRRGTSRIMGAGEGSVKRTGRVTRPAASAMFVQGRRAHRRAMTQGDTHTIVAAVRDGQAGETIRRAAVERARHEGAGLVLYDLDAQPSPLESPLPTNWSADGAEDQIGERLEPDDLEAVGRADLARAVRSVRALGVAAWAWLPETDDARALTAYAARCGASAIVVGSDDASLARGAGIDVDVVHL